MNLLGGFKIGGSNFFLFMHDVKNEETFSIISPFHAEDRAEQKTEENASHVILKSQYVIQREFNKNYLVESVKRSKRTGRVQKYGTSNLLVNVLDALGHASSYRFNREHIFRNEKIMQMGEEHEVFDAADERVQFSYEKLNGLYVALSVRTPAASFELKKVPFTLSVKQIQYKELHGQEAKKILISTLKKIDYDALTKVLDMSWYRENGVTKKDYRSIKTIDEFEFQIITPMVKKILECQKTNCTFHVALDTETTGLNIYHLDKDNPDKDNCVAVPICWEFGKSFVIFTDMEHFQSIPNDYVAKRLAIFFEDFEGEREIEYWEEEEIIEDIDNISPQMEFNPFGVLDTFDSGDGIALEKTKRKAVRRVKKIARFMRSIISLIGHNCGFDGRVFFDLGKLFYFNEDTLQMAFDINPKSVRGSKKLKILTRFFFHSETPELSDVLGKGNEDKYRFLEDEEVAKIYGCADADFTLGIFFKLRSLMTDQMYYYYQIQDIPMINILCQAEYDGMQTADGEVEHLAEEAEQNIKILKEAIYSYVGVYIKYHNDIAVINARRDSGSFATEEEYQEALKSVKQDPEAVYRFEMKPKQLQHVLYDIMKYPVKAYTDKNQPKIDKYVIDKLLKEKLDKDEKPFRTLQKDILVHGCDVEEYERLKAKGSKKADNMCLISAEKINKLRYPLALIIQKYSELNKEYTAYFKPIREQNLEGKIFKGFNLARIETRRIANPGQTMKGSLKAIIRSYSDEYYTLDFDMSQVEQRIMVSMSHFTEMIFRMNDPESDAHRETASMVEGKPPYKITGYERKKAKSVTFGVPYGLGLRKLCEKMFGDTTTEHLMETAIVLHKWTTNNQPIVQLLEEAREQALTEWEISTELRDFMDMWKKTDKGEYELDASGNKIPIPVGRVQNFLGFYRTFNLEGVGQTEADKERRKRGDYTEKEASIRRQAGNYPIQATASEIFRVILIRFYKACKQYGIADKVRWHMLIHDELLCSVKKDVHPFLIYKIVKEACMITMKGHTKYYVGINIGDSWAECKDDTREAPIHFVSRMIKRYDAGEFEEGWFEHPWDFIRPLREQYIEDRIGEVVKSYQPDMDEHPIDLKKLIHDFSNYTVRAYINDYPMNGEIDFVVDKNDPNSVAIGENLTWIKKFETWVLNVYGKGKELIDLDGKIYKITKAETKKAKEEKPVDYDELFSNDFENTDEEDEESYWSFDEDSASIVYGMEAYREELPVATYDDGSDLQFDTTKKGNNVTDITIIQQKYKNLKILNKQLFISLSNRHEIQIIKDFLKPELVEIGVRSVFRVNGVDTRWDKIRANYDFDEIDAFIEFLHSDYVSCVIGNKVIVKICDSSAKKVMERALSRFIGNDYQMIFVSNDRTIFSCKFSKRVSMKKLENMIIMLVG